MRRLHWLLPLAFIAIVVAATVGGLLVIAALTQKNIGAIDLNSQDLKVRLDEIRIMLQLLIVAAGLFAIAQGASAFFNAQAFTKQAEDSIRRIQDQAQEAQARYPIFARTEAVRREAYARLADIFRDPFFLDWRTPAYERLTLSNRQLLLSVERFIGIELLPHPGGKEEYIRDLRRLANFYASKYRYDRSRDGAHWADLERAEYYLNVAKQEAAADCFHLDTDIGLLYMEFHKPRRLDDAERQFRESLRSQPAQQRAHHNLGLLARYREDWPSAIASYTEALRHRNWEKHPMDEMCCVIYYNRACAHARYAAADASVRAKMIRECFENLEEAGKYGHISSSLVDEDLTTPSGAFFAMTAQEKARIEQMRTALTAPPPPRHPLGFVERLKKAADVIWPGR